jgi:hypothetical protein
MQAGLIYILTAMLLSCTLKGYLSICPSYNVKITIQVEAIYLFIYLFYYCAGCGYIVAFTKVLTKMDQIHHT